MTIQSICQSWSADCPLSVPTRVAIRLIDQGSNARHALSLMLQERPSMCRRFLQIADDQLAIFDPSDGDLDSIIEQLGELRTKVCVFVSGLFDDLAERHVNWDLAREWQRTLSCGRIAAAIAQAIPEMNQSRAWTAGILKDVGQLLLLACNPSRFNDVVQAAVSTRSPFNQACEDVLQFHPGELASWVCDRYRFHAWLSVAIATQDRLDAAPDPTLCSLLQVCDHLLEWHRMEAPGSPGPFSGYRSAWDQLGLTVDRFIELYASTKRSVTTRIIAPQLSA